MEPALEAIIYILVSQFSAVQGEDTDEETPAYQLQKEASVYSETNCKEAVRCAGRLALPKEAAICISAAIANKIFMVFEEQRKPSSIGPEYAFPRNQSQHHSI
jgi:hypothetical protein